MVPEIWSETDLIFCHLGPFLPFYPPNDPENQNFEKMKKNACRYYPFTHVYYKWRSYDVWLLKYKVQLTEFFVTLDGFLLFYPPQNPKNQNLEKMKKVPGDIIILQMCTINDNHIMYGSYSSWDMERGRTFWHFGSFFALLPDY